LSARVLLIGLSLAQGAMLARGLGPAGLGRYSAVLVDVNLLVALLSLGLPGALAVLTGETVGRPSRMRLLRRIALRRGLLLLGLLGLGLLAIAAGLRLPGHPLLICLLVSAGVLAQFFRDVQNSLLWGSQRFFTQNRLNLVVQVVLCGAIATLYLKHWLAPEFAVLLQILCNLLWTVAAMAAPRQPREAPAPPAPDPGDSEHHLGRRVLTIGLRNYLSLLLDLLLLRIDVYLIQELSPHATMEHDLGLYLLGVRVAELLLMLPGTLNALLFAKAAAREDVALVTLRSAKLSVWLGLFGLLGMAAVGQPLLVVFFGPRFAGSFVPCLWVLLGSVAMCFSGPLAGTLQGAGGYPRSVMQAQAVALLVNALANIYLLPRYGILGAAVASALAYFISAALIATAFARRFRLGLPELLRPESPWSLWQHLRQA
jgi:O-antigen/teichoic acid export membrane protein